MALAPSVPRSQGFPWWVLWAYGCGARGANGYVFVILELADIGSDGQSVWCVSGVGDVTPPG